MTDPKQAFAKQRAGAARRGIKWHLTYEQWWAIWERSGKWAERGTKRGQYVMARNWDAGPYAEWNVDIQTTGENLRTVQYRRAHKRFYTPSAGPLKPEPSLHMLTPLELLELKDEIAY